MDNSTTRIKRLDRSAPNFPYGTVDNIEMIARLGLKYNIPVHVDCCLGSFVVAFMQKLGYSIRPFDFSVPGVTSISVDTHKVKFYRLSYCDNTYFHACIYLPYCL